MAQLVQKQRNLLSYKKRYCVYIDDEFIWGAKHDLIEEGDSLLCEMVGEKNTLSGRRFVLLHQIKKSKIINGGA